MEQAYTAAGIEPPLEELLNDRIVQLVMRRDGIAPADVWRAVAAARLRPAASPQGAEEQRCGLTRALDLVADDAADSHSTFRSG